MTQLEQLPVRIDDLTSQISQLRTEMRDESSAVRTEMVEQGQSLRTEMAAQSATIISTLHTEIADRDEARGTHMRVLYEDVISRIALLQEGLPPRRGKGKRKGKMEK